MNEFDFPVNAGILLRKKVVLRKALLCSEIKWIDKKVAVLGGSTTNEVVDQLD